MSQSIASSLRSTSARGALSTRGLAAVALALASFGLAGCGESDATNPAQEAAASGSGKSDGTAEGERPTIGILLTSHGDVDEYEEIEPYIRTAFLKNVGVPLPKVLRELLEDPAYWLAKDLIEKQYAAIGPTRYRSNAQLQVNALQAELDRRGVKARVYIGYNFMPEFIEDTLAVMQEDGIEEIVVFNKGAQYSLATLGESIDEVKGYLHHQPQWDVRVTAVRQFSDDPRFVRLFADTLKRDAEFYFPDTPVADRCLLIASHGLPTRLINMGDPAVAQMEATVEELRKLLPEYPLYHGYLNDDYFPGAEWVAPKAIDVAHEMRTVSCPAVLMDGRLSFTTHHRATLFDLDIEARELLEEPDTLADGETPHPLYTPAKVVLAPNWDGDRGFAEFLADLSEEALKGEGDLIDVH